MLRPIVSRVRARALLCLPRRPWEFLSQLPAPQTGIATRVEGEWVTCAHVLSGDETAVLSDVDLQCERMAHHVDLALLSSSCTPSPSLSLSLLSPEADSPTSLGTILAPDLNTYCPMASRQIPLHVLDRPVLPGTSYCRPLPFMVFSMTPCLYPRPCLYQCVTITQPIGGIVYLIPILGSLLCLNISCPKHLLSFMLPSTVKSPSGSSPLVYIAPSRMCP